MKAKVIYTHIHTKSLNVGDVVEIIPGMETDAEGIWNAPAGKLVLCKKEDGTCCYASMLDMVIVDETPSVDWDAFRREATKDVLCAMVANNNLGFYGDSNARLATSAIVVVDELIKQLRGE